MRRGLRWSLFVALAALLGVIVSNPGARTRGYFAVERAWAAHWPFPRGSGLPVHLEPIIRPTTPVWMQVEPAVRMLLDPEDVVSAHILRTGSWETESWNAVQHHLSAGAVFVDVGAHIGYYSLKAASVVGTGGLVIAVEPNPQTVRELEGNIRASGATNISVQAVACSDAETTLTLFASPRANTGMASLSSATAAESGPVAAVYRVRARRLDDLVKEAGVSRVDVMKIDVEGAELLVLRGSVETLTRFHPMLIVEVDDSMLRALGSSEAELRAFLSAHGYTACRSLEFNVEFDWTATVAR
jgi:FkbM family methyltransferase